MTFRTAGPLVALLAALWFPAGAQAITVGVQDGLLRVTGERGKSDVVAIEPAANKRVKFTQEFEAKPGPGCNYGPELYCNAEGGIVVDLRDGNDELDLRTGLPAPLRYIGGSGRDLVRWSGLESLSVAADNDGRADDGPLGLDDIEADVEILNGSFASDVMGSGSRGASIYPRDGDDTVSGGSGRDRIATAYVATDGTEAGYLFVEGRDTVSCGRGQDFVLHDSNDVIASDCEAYGRPAGTPGNGFYAFVGSRGDDFLGAPPGWEPARMNPGAGDDVVQGPVGDTRADLGAGDDRYRGMGIVRGGSGDDYIDVRTGGAAVDQVDCGSGRDRVLANRPDRVARNCERVTRYALSFPR